MAEIIDSIARFAKSKGRARNDRARRPLLL